MGARSFVGLIAVVGLASVASAQQTGIQYQATNWTSVVCTGNDLPNAPLLLNASTVIRLNPTLVISKNPDDALFRSFHGKVVYLPKLDQLAMQSMTIRVYWTVETGLPASASASLTPTPVSPLFGVRSTVYRTVDRVLRQIGEAPQSVQAITFTAN